MSDDAWEPVRERIGQLIHRHGSLRACARALQIDHDYLSRLFSGEKRNPDDVLLRAMGLRRVVRYERTSSR
jgi:AraC-like DNA-binding protein